MNPCRKGLHCTKNGDIRRDAKSYEGANKGWELPSSEHNPAGIGHFRRTRHDPHSVVANFAYRNCGTTSHHPFTSFEDIHIWIHHTRNSSITPQKKKTYGKKTQIKQGVHFLWASALPGTAVVDKATVFGLSVTESTVSLAVCSQKRTSKLNCRSEGQPPLTGSGEES